MSGKRGQGPLDNPWIKPPEPEPADADAGPERPPSPWSQDVPEHPGRGAPGPEIPPDPDPAGQGPGEQGPVGEPETAGPGDSPAPGVDQGPGVGESDPAGSVAWGSQISPPSLRRPVPEPKRRVPPMVLPIAAAVGVLALIAIGLVVLLGGDEPSVKPTSSPRPTTPVTPQPTPSYTPPPNAIPVAFGVSLVPADGWTIFTKEKQGKQVVVPDPSGTDKARASFWVRQKQGLTAETYMLRIVEGEIEQLVAQLGKPRRNLPCPRDVLVECAAITYSATGKDGVKLQGFVETFRRKDGLVTGIDFQTRADYAAKALADAQIMKKSVIDSM